MDLQKLNLSSHAVEANAEDLLSELSDLSFEVQYAHLAQLANSCECAMSLIKPDIIDNHRDALNAALAAGNKGCEFTTEGLCFGLTQKWEHNWDKNDIVDTFVDQNTGNSYSRGRFASISAEIEDLKKVQKLNTQRLNTVKWEIENLHPNMPKINITEILSYKGPKSDDINNQ